MPDKRRYKSRRPSNEVEKHYWLTPPELMRKLEQEFHFDFDPCPYPKPDSFDGLAADWGYSNYVNPPFVGGGRGKGPTAWARKVLSEHAKGKLVCMVFQIDKWVLALLSAKPEIRNLGDVKWCAIEDGKPGKGIGRHIAAFILRPSKRRRKQ